MLCEIWVLVVPSLHGVEGLSQRLDRAICNSEWDSFSPNRSVRNLHRLKSDHRPILISFKLNVSKGLRHFRCLASWMSHVDFGNFVNSSWNTELVVGDNLERFQESVREWNKQVYGNIFVRKRKMISDWKGFKKSLRFVLFNHFIDGSMNYDRKLRKF
ncbi:hypothetical protein ES332_D10G100100v1 [Gossypium tomentosum]|uniref:Endonuclease/exonuclease/phosphatase domain-containing protein n=1 Tax=Gossypium tomentosum TaxID=34277 RepID=A0A5D2J225_GOSTO|nr:hypothetical protein ES332_D10G100100v1 [Gossypium tomentosum]